MSEKAQNSEKGIGDFSYFRSEITEIEYNQSGRITVFLRVKIIISSSHGEASLATGKQTDFLLS